MVPRWYQTGVIDTQQFDFLEMIKRLNRPFHARNVAKPHYSAYIGVDFEPVGAFLLENPSHICKRALRSNVRSAPCELFCVADSIVFP